MCRAMPWPWTGPNSSVRRMRRSSVPWITPGLRSCRAMAGNLPRIVDYLPVNPHRARPTGVSAMPSAGIPIVEPRLGRVRVAAHFPEPAALLREELDAAHPLRALPRIELRRDDAHRA